VRLDGSGIAPGISTVVCLILGRATTIMSALPTRVLSAVGCTWVSSTIPGGTSQGAGAMRGSCLDTVLAQRRSHAVRIRL